MATTATITLSSDISPAYSGYSKTMTLTKADTNNDIEETTGFSRRKFTATDPKISLNTLSIPVLWLFGEKDIQIPVKLCIEQLNTFKVQGKPFEYTLFSALGHNTSSGDISETVDISIEWIKLKALNIRKSKSYK